MVLKQFKNVKEDYLVEVTFKEKPENPDTGAYVSIGIILTILLIIAILYKKNIFKKFKKV